jgi:hypothetical protein
MRMPLYEVEITKIQQIWFGLRLGWQRIPYGIDEIHKFPKASGGMPMLPLWDFELCDQLNSPLQQK